MSEQKSRLSRRAERIRSDVPILRVLTYYGYQVREDAGDREQQYPCDLHGSGADRKPSARAYPVTNSTYCFGCGKARDAIRFVQDKENLQDSVQGYAEAITRLEQRFGLAALPHDPSDYKNPQRELEAVLNPSREITFEQEAHRTQALLDNLLLERDLPMDKLLSYCEAFDMIKFQASPKGSWDEAASLLAMTKLRSTMLG